MTDNTNLVPSTVTTWNGNVIAGTITSTAHQWTADATGLFHTTADLSSEWKQDYSILLAGHGNTLNGLQRMEGNAEAALENTNVGKLSATKQDQYRQDEQRELDSVWSAQQTAQKQFGINPNQEFNTYTYQKVGQILQSDNTLSELALQGHGTNNPIAPKYSGYTTDFQNNTDNTTYYVGGGEDNGETALPNLVDDVAYGHLPFATVQQDGVAWQLNQNGDREDPLSYTIAGQNEAEYDRVFVASDFSTNPNAVGAQVFNTGIQAASALPVAGAGQITTQDGSVISGTITAGEHTWVADSTGLLHTKTDLAAEWKSDYALLQAGGTLTSEQRQEANGEAVLENTSIAHASVATQLKFREDLTRQFDSEAAGQQIDKTLYGTSPTAQFTNASYIQLSDTILHNEGLEELYTQGHGLNGSTIPTKYRGFTDDFQNNTDNSTNYTGQITKSSTAGYNALGNYVDEELLGHFGGPAVLTNSDPSHIRIVQQNSELDQNITTAVQEANATFFTLKTNAASFSTAPRTA